MKLLINDTLNLAIKALEGNSRPKNSPSLHPFSKILQELYVQNNILLKSDRIVLPKTLYENALSLVHQNHWGIEKTKHMIREFFWWPKMNNNVEDLVKTCSFCQTVRPSSQFKPLTRYTCLRTNGSIYMRAYFAHFQQVNTHFLSMMLIQCTQRLHFYRTLLQKV